MGLFFVRHEGGPARRTLRLRRLLGGALAVVAALCALPYLYPVSRYEPRSALPHANGAFRTVEGVSVYSRLWEPACAVSGNVLLVHGFGSSTYAWEKIVPALIAAGCRVVAVDVPGFGYSDKNITWPYSHERNATLLWALVDQLAKESGISGSAAWTLVGHSMGGEIVVRMAGSRPAQARQVVLADGAVLGRRPHPLPWLRFPPLRRWAFLSVEFLSRRPAVLRRFLGSAYGRRPTPEELQGYAAPICVPGTTRALFKIADSHAGLRDVNAILKELTSPVSLIWGEKDTWVSLRQGRRVAELINRPLLVVPDAGHCPMETHPDAFARILLSELSARR